VITRLIARVTARTVVVTIVVVIVVAVVPITVLSVAPGDDNAARKGETASHARTLAPAAPQKVPPRVKFRSDAEDLIAALRNAEAACSSSMTALIQQADLSAGETIPILFKARGTLEEGVGLLVAKVQGDMEHAARARTLTQAQLDIYVTDLTTIRLLGLGSDAKQGSIATICSTVTAQVQQEIAVFKPPPPAPPPPGDGGDGSD
jgi:hypothetical protein